MWIDKNKTREDLNRNCCGCSACSNVCPKSAIQMVYDEEGFVYPKVNEDICVECGACVKICPICAEHIPQEDYLETYAGYSTNAEIMSNCTSGGFVTELSQHIIHQGGVVYGVAYDESYVRSQYIRVETEEGLKVLMGSKYVQSEKKDIYLKVKQDARAGRLVLFVGCPCDIAALKLFLKTEYENLYTCELVCMGVTSYKIAEDYKNYTEKKHSSKLVYINARSKKRGWFVPQLEERFENGKEKLSTLFGTYYGYGFQVYNRPSCFQCRYRNKSGFADFRVGDFWGIKQTDPFWNPEGVSCIFVRTERGQQVMNELKEKGFQLFITDYDTATINNMSSRVNKPIKYQELRKKFAYEYREHGLIKACKATESMPVKIKRYAPQRVQWLLKRIYHVLRDTRTK